MNKKIISMICLSVFTIGSLTACSEETQVSSNSKYFDTNTGTFTNDPYADYKTNREAFTMNPMDNTQIAQVDPNNDPKLMDNPSAVENVSENATQRNNENIQTPSYVNENDGYVDKPYNQIASSEVNTPTYNSETMVDKTYENEEEQNRIKNSDNAIIHGLNQQLEGIDYNIENLKNMNNVDNTKLIKLYENYRMNTISKIAEYEKY